MKNIFAVRHSDNVIVSDITASNTVPSGCYAIHAYDNLTIREANGTYRYKFDNGEILIRQLAEIESSAEYKAWWNAKIESQLEKLDIKRIRPGAEINDDNMSAQDKQQAKVTLKTLNEQAATLRAQMLK